MIAIPNMEKPKNCHECPIRIGETLGVYYDSKSDEYKRVKIIGCDEAKYHTKTLGEGYKMMYKDCPLIEIVMCKDCKWLGVDDGMPFCDWWLREIEPNVFCSYGERKSDPNKCKECELVDKCDHHICLKAVRERRTDE